MSRHVKYTSSYPKKLTQVVEDSKQFDWTIVAEICCKHE